MGTAFTLHFIPSLHSSPRSSTFRSSIPEAKVEGQASHPTARRRCPLRGRSGRGQVSRKRDINDRSCGWAILSLLCRTRTINEGKAESVRVRADEQSDMYRSYSYTSNGRGGRRGRAHFNIVPILRTVSLTHDFPRISPSSS